MNVKIVHDAKQATGLAVIIDVFRAFTVEPYLIYQFFFTCEIYFVKLEIYIYILFKPFSFHIQDSLSYLFIYGDPRLPAVKLIVIQTAETKKISCKRRKSLRFP